MMKWSGRKNAINYCLTRARLMGSTGTVSTFASEALRFGAARTAAGNDLGGILCVWHEDDVCRGILLLEVRDAFATCHILAFGKTEEIDRLTGETC